MLERRTGRGLRGRCGHRRAATEWEGRCAPERAGRKHRCLGINLNGHERCWTRDWQERRVAC
eukprot:14753930-Alexandrium_andersonii.AAC.1